MEDLLLHPSTREQIKSFTSSGNHALLLTGALGSGKETLAQQLSKDLLHVSSLENTPYFSSVKPDGKHVTIEQIRGVVSFLQLKTTGRARIRRVVVIHNADTMTDEAQNALLKSVEEPPDDTVLILTATRFQDIRHTIQSRTQQIAIKRVSVEDATSYFNTKYSAADIVKAHTLSDGQVGLLKALLEDHTEHPVANQIIAAKKLYGMTTFQRLAQIDGLAKKKDELPELIYACKRICTGALKQAAEKSQKKSIETWHRQLSIICQTEEQLRYSPNSKLLLTDLFMQM